MAALLALRIRIPGDRVSPSSIVPVRRKSICEINSEVSIIKIITKQK